MVIEKGSHCVVESAGIPAGVFEMNSGSLGRYDECLSIAVPDDANSSLVAFRGSFCSVFLKAQGNPFLRKLMRRVFENTPEMKKRIGSFREFESLQENPYQLGLRAAVCAPSTCTATDMESLLTAAAEPYGIQVKVPVCNDSSPTTLGADQVFSLCALVCLLMVVIVASAVDLWLRYSPKTNQAASKDCKTTKAQLLLSFSAVTNTRRLFDFSAGAGGRLRCLDGVRFLSAVWVVLIHNYVVAEPNSMGNIMDVLALRSNIALTTVFSGFLSIETFFLLR
ncbi:nose resistant to fluoxetine protein 6-like [Dermacentor silvarum]|uniref:nose resistant to fluoxetine protein 6-like n=1 Tax=Dermacentor silvarum TaxID=543639 RepID=UPI0021012F6E|nr:nose resistant to fluoxetine protein 6-like [Dermacentor silvarum]